MKINLLPRKEFELIDGDQKICGKFSNWAIIRLCEKKQLTRAQLREAFDNDDVVESIYAELLLCAVEYVSRLRREEFDYIDVDAFDWIERIGGFRSQEFLSLMLHAFDEGAEKEEAKKKVEELSLNGTTLKESVTHQG